MRRPSLANAELAVRELRGQKGRVTARQIPEQRYPGTTRPQHGTVLRLLQRLEDKRFVERDRELPVHLFWAVISREAYERGRKGMTDLLLQIGVSKPLISFALAIIARAVCKTGKRPVLAHLP